MKKVLVLAGPTASGKTSHIKIAKHFNFDNKWRLCRYL